VDFKLTSTYNPMKSHLSPPPLPSSQQDSVNKSNSSANSISSQNKVKHQPPPLPNKKFGDLNPDEIAILLPPDEDDDDDEPIAVVVKKTSKPLSVDSAPNLPPPKPLPPPINLTAMAEETKAQQEHSQNSLLVKSIAEQKQKRERKTLIVTIILSVVGSLLFTLLVAYFLSPTQLQKYEPMTDNKTDPNIHNEKSPDNSNDIYPQIELIEEPDY
jgi:cytoskeletal protein RodZ